jgi:hypothetical protein
MFPVAPGIASATAVADQSLEEGGLYKGLTYDDVGGLCYVYSTNTIKYETLLPGISGVGTNSFVNSALRPGIGKITFMSQPVDPVTSAFLPMTNCYTDTYISNGATMQQQLARVISQPDFLFCAGDVSYAVSNPQTFILSNVPLLERTGTTNWINNAALNGNPGGGGPGIIQPQVKITFNKLGNVMEADWGQFVGEDGTVSWGTFDNTTNLPIVYPVSQNGMAQFDIRLLLSFPGRPYVQFDWPQTNAAGSASFFQISTNLTDWTTLFPATNNGTIWTFFNYDPLSSQQFYRVVPQ